MKNLDLLDRKILYELDIDARQPLSKLAKKLRKGRNVIDYRMKRLIKKGIIKGFFALLDAGTLGVMVWNVHVSFQNTTEAIEKEIVDYLKKKDSIWWMASTSGNWDLIYTVLVQDIRQFYAEVDDFNRKYSSYIQKQSLVAHVDIDIFTRGYFLKKPSLSGKWYRDKVSIDEVDKAILKELTLNARMSTVDLANQLGLTARIVAYRIRELQKKGVIHRFRLQLDVKKFGYSFFKILIYHKNLDDSALFEYCKQLGNIIHYERKIGPWMLELEFEEESYEKMHQVMKKMKETFPIIRSFEILHIHDEPKGELDMGQVF